MTFIINSIVKGSTTRICTSTVRHTVKFTSIDAIGGVFMAYLHCKLYTFTNTGSIYYCYFNSLRNWKQAEQL